MEIILRGVYDKLLPADDGMPWHVKNQIILPLTSQSVSYLIFDILIQINMKMMIQLGRILSYQIITILFVQKFTAKYFSSQVSY